MDCTDTDRLEPAAESPAVMRSRPVSWLSPAAFALAGLLVTAVVFATGGSQSPLLVLYLPAVMLAAVKVSRTGALLMATLYSLMYSVMLWWISKGILPALDSALALGAPHRGILLQLVGLVSGMVLVSVAASFLAKAVRLREQMVEQSRREIRDLSMKHKELVDSISTGLITTDLQGRIISINQAAAVLLGVSENEALSATLSELFSARDTEFNTRTERLEEGETRGELEFSNSAGASVRVIYHARDLCTETACPSGRVVVLQDVTKQRSIEEQLALQERMARLLASTEELPSNSRTRFSDLVGESPVMLKVYNLIDRVAPTDATVLINGESGTGKELVARSIHFTGHRGKKPFVPVNCGAIPESLIESQLFGHRRGSFTGAVADYDGFFKQADSGTIFLDEVGELPQTVQVKLLRAIQERCIRRQFLDPSKGEPG